MLSGGLSFILFYTLLRIDGYEITQDISFDFFL